MYTLCTHYVHIMYTLCTHYVHTFGLKENTNNKYILENFEKFNFIIDAHVLVCKTECVSIG
jgi:hypothetical protein